MINLIKRLFIVVLLSFITANVYAAYATLDVAYSVCAAAIAPVNAYGYNVEICEYQAPRTIQSKYHVKNGWNGTTWLNDVTYLATVGCTLPAAWSSITNTCFTPPVCISPNQLNLQGTACYLPRECAYPETDNGSGVCANNTCPAGQNRNPLSNLCQTPPVCGSTETYDLSSNTCKLYPLNCPGNTHANSTNDACLANAPLACPSGQHDDGTYTCVADDIKGCKSNQQPGYINGIPQCITKPNLDTAQAAAAAAASAALNAAGAVTTAKTNLAAADVALSADPSNIAKQTARQVAYDSLEIAVANERTYQGGAANKGNEYSNNLLNSIDQGIKTQTSLESTANGETNALLSSIDSTLKETGQGPELSDLPGSIEVPNQTIGIAADPNYQASGTCPAPITVSTSFKTLSFSFEYLCQLGESISGVVLALAWLAAGRIVFGTSTV